MPLITLKDILSESIEQKYAIGAFDTTEHVLAEAIIEAAEETNTPVILMTPDFVLDLPNADNYFSYLHNRIDRSSVPVALHLDHGSSMELAIRAIHYGFSSVMFDGSNLPLEENIEKTKEITWFAHACGVSVEAEIGHVGGGEGNTLAGNDVDVSGYTNVDDAVRFATETGVDALAIAIGTVHGIYKGTPKLDYERIKAIRTAVEVPLVMHGGSGLPPEAFRRAIECGINKINFFTGMSVAAVRSTKELLDTQNGNIIHYPEMIACGQQTAKRIVKEQIQLFGTKPLTVKTAGGV